MTLTEYSPLPKTTSSTSTKSQSQAENATFFWWGHGQTIPLRCTKTCHFKWKIHFFPGRGLAPSTGPSPGENGYPLHTSSLAPLVLFIYSFESTSAFIVRCRNWFFKFTFIQPKKMKFSFCHLWTLTHDLDLWNWPRYGQDELTRQRDAHTAHPLLYQDLQVVCSGVNLAVILGGRRCWYGRLDEVWLSLIHISEPTRPY